MVLHIIGHKNPDTDSVCSAIALADLKNKLGVESKPFIQGEIAPETKFILDKFNIPKPDLLTDATDKDIFLVDHSDLAQSLDNLDKGNVVGIVDHHKLGDVTTSTPLEFWALPVGCSCTVLKQMYDFYKVPMDQNIAGIMLGAILSDTVIFKSPTCTDDDRIAAEELAQFAGIQDTKEFGMEMFKVKSAIDGVDPKELLLRDYKDFDMNGKKVGVGQLEVVDIKMFDKIKEQLQEAVNQQKADGRHTVLLLLTDIIQEGSELLMCSDDESLIEKAFTINSERPIWLDKVMSRKKQVIPKLEGVFK